MFFYWGFFQMMFFWFGIFSDYVEVLCPKIVTWRPGPSLPHREELESQVLVQRCQKQGHNSYEKIWERSGGFGHSKFNQEKWAKMFLCTLKLWYMVNWVDGVTAQSNQPSNTFAFYSILYDFDFNTVLTQNYQFFYRPDLQLSTASSLVQVGPK